MATIETHNNTMWKSLLSIRELKGPVEFFDLNGAKYALPEPKLRLSPLFTKNDTNRKIRILRLADCVITLKAVWPTETKHSGWKKLGKQIAIESAEISICLEESEHFFLWNGVPIRIKKIYLGTESQHDYNYSEKNCYAFSRKQVYSSGDDDY